MAVAVAKNKRNTSLARALLEVDVKEGEHVYILRSPMADDEDHQQFIKNTRSMYGIEFTKGVGVTLDKDLAERIHGEFPDYSVTEA